MFGVQRRHNTTGAFDQHPVGFERGLLAGKGEQLIELNRLPSLAAAMLGDKGAAKRQGDINSIIWRDGVRPQLLRMSACRYFHPPGHSR